VVEKVKGPPRAPTKLRAAMRFRTAKRSMATMTLMTAVKPKRRATTMMNRPHHTCVHCGHTPDAPHLDHRKQQRNRQSVADETRKTRKNEMRILLRHQDKIRGYANLVNSSRLWHWTIRTSLRVKKKYDASWHARTHFSTYV
jgi:hypothetical protein